MNNQLFRAKSIEKVTSPEQLDAYIRVSTPGVWMVLAAIIILLTGVCVWGIMGRLDTTVPAVAEVRENQVTLYVKEADIRDISLGMTVDLDGQSLEVTNISAEPVMVDEQFSQYARHVGQLQLGEWVYAVTCSGTLSDGIYGAQIVTESVAPMSFVIN